MNRCEYCQRDFKTAQALAGHRQWKHGQKPAAEGAAQQVDQLITRQEVQQLLAAREPDTEQQADLLEQIAEQLERLERAAILIEQGKAAGVADHSHGMADPNCHDCRVVVGESLELAERKGAAKAVASYEAIPGVKNLREAWEEANRIDPDGDHNWTPNVIAAAARGEELITITG